MFAPILQFLLASGAPTPQGPGPSAAPTNGRTHSYGAGKIRLTWVNGDSTAYTRFTTDGSVAPQSGIYANPGETSIDTPWDYSESQLITFSHWKNGQESDIIEWDHPLGP